MNDLLISVLQAPDMYGRVYGWDTFTPFVNSLEQSGFQGQKVLLVSGIDSVSRDNFHNRGYELIDYSKDESKPYFIARHKPLLDYLEPRYKNFRYILWSDIRDVVVQSNPAAWMEQHSYNVVVTTEAVKFKNNPYNEQWIQQFLGNSSMQDEAVCNYGILIGDAEPVFGILSKVKSILYAGPEHIVDQAVFNCVLRESPFKEVTRMSNSEDGFGVSMCCLLNPGKCRHIENEPIYLVKPPRLIDGIVYPAESVTPFCMVHQYGGGNQQWFDAIRRQYL